MLDAGQIGGGKIAKSEDLAALTRNDLKHVAASPGSLGLAGIMLAGLRLVIQSRKPGGRAAVRETLAVYFRRIRQAPRARKPTSLEQWLARYLTNNAGRPTRFFLRLVLDPLNHEFGETALIRILAVGLNARDPNLVRACLVQLTQSGTSNRSLLRQLAGSGVSFGGTLGPWLEKVLSKQLEVFGREDPNAAAAFTDKLADLLTELLRNLSPTHVRDIAKALLPFAPENTALLVLLGHCEKWTGNLEESRVLLERALIHPDCDPIVYFELSETLGLLYEDDAAIEAARKGYERTTEEELFLNYPGWLTASAGSLMRQGNIHAGWQQRQKRRDRFVIGEHNSPRQVWNGPNTQCESVLVCGESGIGDELKFASCYADLQACVTRVVASADPRLIPLLKRSYPDVEFVGLNRSTPSKWRQKALEGNLLLNRAIDLNLFCALTAFDSYVMSGDLPFHFRKSREAFPRRRGYLVADEEKRAEWRRRLDALGPGLKVGLSWRSASYSYKREQHYFSIEQLLPILKVEGVHFVCLQYDDCEEELERLERDHGIAVHRWRDRNLRDDIDGVAALITELDLVIAPHTMVKELAGAIGTRTLFMVPTTSPSVRWRQDPKTGEDIWHSSVTHIAAESFGDKESVIWQTKERLEAVVAERGGPAKTKRHVTGIHEGEAQKSEPKIGEKAPDSLTNVLRNDYGETFVPAGHRDIPDRAVRDAELDKRDKKFEAVVANLFRQAVQPERPEGVLLVLGLSHKQYALTVLAAHALLKHNWAAVAVDEVPFELGKITDPNIAYFRGLLIRDKKTRRRVRQFHLRGEDTELKFEWEIDFRHRICRAEGINFYGTIINRLGKESRKYISDITDPDTETRFHELLRTCDTALAICFEAEKRLAGRGMKVRFTGYEPDYPPTGVVKVYCAERGYEHGIEFAEIKSAYEKYYRGGNAYLTGAIDCQNVTRHKLNSAQGIRRDKFEPWFEAKRSDGKVAERCRQWAMQSRTGNKEPMLEGNIVLNRIRQHRQRGGKVACLYGSVPFDFADPWLDQGPAHYDRRDWLNHTVATVADSNVLLLIKPHPDEVRAELFGVPAQYFVELLDGLPPKNVIIMGHRWLNNADLMPEIDFGIAWRGSVTNELALMRVPVIVCNPRSMLQQVLDFPVPKHRADYEDMLRHPERIVMSDELVERASMVFEFYKTEGMIPYPFGWIPHIKRLAGVPVWSEGALQDYLANGHPSIDEMCKRIISPQGA